MASKWIDGVLAVRRAAKELRAARGRTRGWRASPDIPKGKGPLVYAAIHKATKANKRLVRLAQKRLAVFCRVLPKFGLVMTGAALEDGTAIFQYQEKNFVLKEFHMKSFRKDVFREFGVDGGPWTKKDLAFSKREKALVKTHFRFARVEGSLYSPPDDSDPDSKPARMYREEAIDWYNNRLNGGFSYTINVIPPKALWEAEFGWHAAFLALYCSAEFRNLPHDIKKIIGRMVLEYSKYL
jgi:hypothetical protein